MRRKHRKSKKNPGGGLTSYLPYIIAGAVGLYALLRKKSSGVGDPPEDYARWKKMMMSTLPTGPSVVTDPGQIDVQTGEVTPSYLQQMRFEMSPTDVSAATAAMGPLSKESYEALVAQRAREEGYYQSIGQSTQSQSKAKALMAAAAAAGVGGKSAMKSLAIRPIAAISLKSKSPDVAQVDPDSARRQKIEEIRRGAVSSAERSVAGLYESAIKNKAVSDSFMRSMKERTGDYNAIKFEAGQPTVRQGASNEAIAVGFYAGVDSKTGSGKLREYQNDFVKQTKLAKDLIGDKPDVANMQKLVNSIATKQASGAALTSTERQFVSVTQSLNEKNSVAQEAFKQAVDIKQLEGKQAAERQELKDIARERNLDVNSPQFAQAQRDLQMQHNAETARLKAAQGGMRTSTSEAQRLEWQQPTPEAVAVNEQRAIATELVKQAVSEGKYKVASGESFEDAIKREMATGNIGRDSAMRAAAEKRLADMRAAAAKEQASAVSSAAALPLPQQVAETVKSVPVVAAPTPSLAAKASRKGFTAVVTSKKAATSQEASENAAWQASEQQYQMEQMVSGPSVKQRALSIATKGLKAAIPSSQEEE